MTFLSILKGFGDILAKIPPIVWAILFSFGVAWFGRGYVDSTKQAMRDTSMIHNATITLVPFDVDLPKPEPKPIKGKALPLPDSIANELRELRERKISDSLKIALYNNILTERSAPFESTYEDSVQKSIIVSYPVARTIFPDITYKPQKVMIPEKTFTLPPKELSWYQKPTARVIYGLIGAGCIYEASQTQDANRMYWSMGAVVILTFGIEL